MKIVAVNICSCQGTSGQAMKQTSEDDMGSTWVHHEAAAWVEHLTSAGNFLTHHVTEQIQQEEKEICEDCRPETKRNQKKGKLCHERH